MSETWKEINNEAVQSQNLVIKKLSKQYIDTKNNLQGTIIEIIACKLSDNVIGKSDIEHILTSILNTEHIIAFEQDLIVCKQRDYACEGYLEILFMSPGYLGLQTYRFANTLWKQGDRSTAKWLSYRIREKLGIDIHPGATIGKRLVIDHGVGIVIGETTVIGDDVFMFHNVTLGGTGHTNGDRHPKVGDNVVIGAGATILGNIHIGNDSVIASGAMVLKDVEAGYVVAGIPAEKKARANEIQKG